MSSPPAFLFAAVGLRKGSGGIAELSRQVFRTLLDMHREKLITLEVNVLEAPGPEANDELFNGGELPIIRWFSGNRWKFALSLVFAKSDIQLLDHVGLGRLPGLVPPPMGRPYILMIHGIEIWNNTRSDYHRTAKKADLLIANSKYTAQKALAHYPDLPEIKICHPGKDISVGGRHAGDSFSDENTRPHGGLLQNIGPHAMLIVGRLSAEQKHKGHDHLIEALPLILQTVPDAQLVITGEGDDQPRLQQKAEALKVAEHIVFTGWADEQQLQRLYLQCVLFVLPSDGDGFGLVFLEAMAHSLPCVGLRSGAAAEIFTDEESGVLVDRDDLPGMANCLAGLLQDESRRQRLGKAGHERYQSQFRAQHYSSLLKLNLADYLAAT